jgi:polygalacturonase
MKLTGWIVAFGWVAFSAMGIRAEEVEYAFDARDFGAGGDARKDDTEAIQKALDRAGVQGGGVVHLPPDVPDRGHCRFPRA